MRCTPGFGLAALIECVVLLYFIIMGEFGAVRDKWVCPNDRELSLRAKLKTGWSVKTSSVNTYNKPEQLNDSEQEVIMNVIRRAENLDQTEQERVGRLVERLENMKKNAIGNGSSQCVLCADEFGLLGASPLLCNDCKKAVCTKCSVDTLSAHKELLWLCKICAETRETWKKSGAWFYKDLPKYILPGKKPDQQAKYASSSTTLNKGPTEQSTNSPVCSYNAWLQSKGRSSSDKEYTDSSDDEIKAGKLSRRSTAKKLISDSESTEFSISTPDTIQLNLKLAQRAPSSAYVLQYTSSGYSVAKELVEEVPEVVPVSYERGQDPEIFKPPSQNSAEFSSPNVDNTWYKARKGVEENETPLPPKPSFKGHARRDSISSTASYCNGRTRMHQQHQVMYQQQQMTHQQHQMTHQQHQVTYQQQPFPHHIPQDRTAVLKSAASCEDIISPEGASTLEFSVLYDAHNQAMHCIIYRAKSLRGTDYDGLADPFIRLQLVPVQNKSDKMRTRTVHKTLNPEFNETVTFLGITDYDLAKRILRLTVMDEDPFGNDFMGETHLSLKKMKPYQTKHFHVYLDQSMELEDGEEEISRGRVLISLMYSGEHHALIVGVLRCIQLPSRDNHSTGYCDPYVRILLKPDHLRRRYKTATKKKTLNPEYNEEFVFEVKPHEMSKKNLEISVWDKDFGKVDDYIGGLALGIQSKGDRLCHWLDMMRNPDRRIERWHPLSNTIMLD